MGLEYDFDIVAIAPDEVDPEHGIAALTGDRAVRAWFRDARTVAALRSASPKICRIFVQSGFSLKPRDSGVPHGVYLPEDAPDRERILRRLFANIRNMGVQGEHFGEFDFRQFLDDVKRARPQADSPHVVPDQAPPQPHESKPKKRSVQWRIGIALGLAVLVIAILRYLAASGATP